MLINIRKKSEVFKLNNQVTTSVQNSLQNQAVDNLKIEFQSLVFPKQGIDVIGTPVTAATFDLQIEMMLEWASSYASKVVCVANVHMLTEAYWHPEFGSVLKSADMVTPDGMPLVWMMRLMGARHQNRVAGMDILLSLCQLAPPRNITIFFLGSEAAILDKMREKLECEFPNLTIAGMEPLPFRPLTRAEDDAIIQKLHDSGAGIVLVSLGCPKQEYWMNQHKDKIQAVMVGLGGVFPVYAGIHKRAPLWIRNLGLEWFYRLIQEPRRLWKRYRTTIPPFIWLAFRQLLSSKLKFR
jgi:N-acetylglucosaminyldiphosphoundecaprenol N-acetyl-beta-D-mannosaminyltransferase